MKRNIYVVGNIKSEFSISILGVEHNLNLTSVFEEGCIGVLPVYTNEKKALKQAQMDEENTGKKTEIMRLGKAEI